MRNPRNHEREIRSRLIVAGVLGWSIAYLLAAGVVPPAAGRWPLSDAQPASEKYLEQFIREFESSYQDVRTFRAEFTQTYRGEGRTRAESGTVYFGRGGLMRWDYREPEEKVFLSDGRNLMLYIPAEKQLTRSSVKSSEDVRVPFSLLLARLKVRKMFRRIEFADEALDHAPGDRVLRAFPKGGSDDYRDVLIELGAMFDVRRLVVSYPDRSVMEFGFDHIERNVGLSPALFRFDPPPGTEVIDQH